jgi:gas vesicle protein
MNRAIGFLIGALAGAAVGASLALLFTPRSGEELRQEINDRIEYVQNEVKLAAQQRRSELEQQLAELRAPRRPPVV